MNDAGSSRKHHLHRNNIPQNAFDPQALFMIPSPVVELPSISDDDTEHLEKVMASMSFVDIVGAVTASTKIYSRARLNLPSVPTPSINTIMKSTLCEYAARDAEWKTNPGVSRVDRNPMVACCSITIDQAKQFEPFDDIETIPLTRWILKCTAGYLRFSNTNFSDASIFAHLLIGTLDGHLLLCSVAANLAFLFVIVGKPVVCGEDICQRVRLVSFADGAIPCDFQHDLLDAMMIDAWSCIREKIQGMFTGPLLHEAAITCVGHDKYGVAVTKVNMVHSMLRLAIATGGHTEFSRILEPWKYPMAKEITIRSTIPS
jgi:hypothetical protein